MSSRWRPISRTQVSPHSPATAALRPFLTAGVRFAPDARAPAVCRQRRPPSSSPAPWAPPDPAADRRRGGQAGAREQPGHPGRPLRPADRGSEYRAARRPLDADLHTTLQNNSNDDSPTTASSPGARAARRPQRHSATSASADAALGRQLRVGWDSSRSTTNNLFTTFSPQLDRRSRSTTSSRCCAASASTTPGSRCSGQLKNREIADVGAAPDRRHDHAHRAQRLLGPRVRHRVAGVQQQSLELAQESLRNTRARVEIGTTPPIDIVEAEAEVARARRRSSSPRRRSRRPRTRCARSSSIRDAGLLDHRIEPSTCRRSSRSPSTSTPRCATRSSGAPISSRRASRSRPTTSTSASSATRRCPTSARNSTTA